MTPHQMLSSCCQSQLKILVVCVIRMLQACCSSMILHLTTSNDKLSWADFFTNGFAMYKADCYYLKVLS